MMPLKQDRAMFDTIEKMDHSLIQHGPLNQRVYLMKVSEQDLPELLPKIELLAENKGYTKIFAKVPQQVKTLFGKRDYQQEAAVPNFYNGHIDAVFLAKYLDESRREDTEQEKIEHIIDLAQDKARQPCDEQSTLNAEIRPATEADVDAIVGIYKQVFESYPFPIHEPDYIHETMDSHIRYFCAFENDQMVAVSSAEMDKSSENVEMTDFATLPAYRKQGLAQHLLKTMEKHMEKIGMQTFYTIARALSPGMNITFARCGYEYGGTLTNNTNICGDIESMNVWYKSADDVTGGNQANRKAR
jgi:putative beta-lysine N-acetyltransferase